MRESKKERKTIDERDFIIFNLENLVFNFPPISHLFLHHGGEKACSIARFLTSRVESRRYSASLFLNRRHYIGIEDSFLFRFHSRTRKFLVSFLLLLLEAPSIFPRQRENGNKIPLWKWERRGGEGTLACSR